MKTYFIFKNNLKDKDFRALDNGFCYFALIFGPFWGLIKGLWFYSLINLSIMCCLEIFYKESLIIFIFFSQLFWAFLGKDLLIQNLIVSNFTVKKVITASSNKKALLTYFSEQT